MRPCPKYMQTRGSFIGGPRYAFDACLTDLNGSTHAPCSHKTQQVHQQSHALRSRAERAPPCLWLPSHAELQEPLLGLLLRYLLHLHGVLQHSLVQPAKPGQEQELLESLLLPGREAQPLPVEHFSGSLREADVQAVIQCTGTARTAAVAALRRSGESVARACALIVAC